MTSHALTFDKREGHGGSRSCLNAGRTLGMFNTDSCSASGKEYHPAEKSSYGYWFRIQYPAFRYSFEAGVIPIAIPVGDPDDPPQGRPRREAADCNRL